VCTYSMVARTWEDIQYPSYPKTTFEWDRVTREEFDKLKKEVESLIRLLKAAKDFDTLTGQTDCEDIDKVKLIKQIADALDVDISEII
jgi:hypothetical protein